MIVAFATLLVMENEDEKSAKPPKRIGRPPLGHVKMFAYVPKEFADALKDEARRRGKTLGALIMEAFDERTICISH